MLTICFYTSRLEPRLDWFFDSLRFQQRPEDAVRVVVVDAYAEEEARREKFVTEARGTPFLHVLPKPNVWQGKHRLTRDNWWAIANARNTGICHAADGWIAWVDDRSILMPDWFAALREAMAGGYAVCGAYQKVFHLEVNEGRAVRYGQRVPCPKPGCQVMEVTTECGVRSAECGTGTILGERNVRCGQCGEVAHIPGLDARWPQGRPDAPVPAPGSWWCGGTAALPVDWALQVNGVDETCDSLGLEDNLFGCMLRNNKYPIQYDRRLMVLEDRTPGPAQESSMFRRCDKGVSPNDKSHALLYNLRDQRRAIHKLDLRAVRAVVQSGGEFPIPTEPTHDWYDGQPLAKF